MVRRFRFGVGFSRADGFDAHICRGEIAIEKCRVGLIIFLDSAHNWARKVNVAGGRTLLGSWPRKVMN